ncbi:hypothetical protein Pedsa_0613 [Pseudopedobacter saltans DSM 12145]|uniref:Glycerophosphoryl diester phosphodiesterase membrane domain-containing protein n=1 Tax=Pseudopedobacter saltans (strain ATCC 51119 / DSM 12145 / JCM 21818 / CCUG 39354 / LMG 10337 / NBRC 100064 / NCIMB 13643) TaxID=762903 RepID=F0S7G5_PSESL|nr:glycerophosphoryl diester phosphodiesterase membrane domain-containing protein [Pseudopedobacter saltans]ADY51190.1 hypothetical protein Pedsa_0613 [Pseudopedobacter saltans DSM 12145]
MDRGFSVIEVLETAWDITKKNFIVIVGYSLMAFISLFVVQFVSTFLIASSNVFINFITLFLVLIVNSIATLGFYKLAFHLIDYEDQEVTFKSVLPSWQNISSFISLTLLLGFIVASLNLIYVKLDGLSTFHEFVETLKESPAIMEILATIALILILLITMRFMFFPCFIVDDNSTSFESLRQSRQLTENNLMKIITVLLVVVGFIVLGFLALGVGIIVTYPFTNIILVVTYRKLVNTYGVIEEEVKETSSDNEEPTV